MTTGAGAGHVVNSEPEMTAREFPVVLRSGDGALLPEYYTQAVFALATCVSIDECREWSHWAVAFTSYATQANDERMLNDAKRIRVRAVRRIGELLAEIAPAQGGDRGGGRPRADGKPTVGRVPVGLTRTQAARDAGLSDDQRKQALRLARIPAADFETALARSPVPTVEDLELLAAAYQIEIAIEPSAARRPSTVLRETERQLGRLEHALDGLDRLLDGLRPDVLAALEPRRREVFGEPAYRVWEKLGARLKALWSTADTTA